MPARIGILLTPEFGLTSFTSIVETLRSANTLAERALYGWTILAERPGPVASTAGVAILAEAAPGGDDAFDMLFVPAAGNPALFDHAGIFAWLRRLHRHGTLLAGVSGGAFLLARAGLLDGRRFTIHWEHIAPLREAFPQLAPRQTLYELDRGIATAAGGIATFDLMLALIARDHGAGFAARVADWLLHTQHRPGAEGQRMAAARRHDVRRDDLARVLEHMERHAETPLDIAALARLAGMSGRQLQRLFQAQVGMSVHRHLTALRLERARILLRQSPLAIAEVAGASGYASASHFSQVFRERFGHAPREERENEIGRSRQASGGKGPQAL